MMNIKQYFLVGLMVVIPLILFTKPPFEDPDVECDFGNPYVGLKCRITCPSSKKLTVCGCTLCVIEENTIYCEPYGYPNYGMTYYCQDTCDPGCYCIDCGGEQH